MNNLIVLGSVLHTLTIYDERIESQCSLSIVYHAILYSFLIHPSWSPSTGGQTALSRLCRPDRGHYQLPSQGETDSALFCDLPNKRAEIHGKQ